jgi:hypothetical protein
VKTTKLDGVAPLCPTCQATLDGVTDPAGENTPRPGDFTVCAYCQEILTFTDELGLRLLEEEDIKLLPLRFMSRIQAAITKAKKGKPVS